MARKAFFNLMYWFSNPPWNTGITPPEVYQYLSDRPAGKALDLGCGTGTNVLTMAEAGWKAVGVDFVPRAIRIARRKVRRAGLDHMAVFRVADVLQEGFIEGEFDLVLDIGCFHSFSGTDIDLYCQNVSQLLSPGGEMMLYVHLNPGPDPGHGLDRFHLRNDQIPSSRHPCRAEGGRSVCGCGSFGRGHESGDTVFG